MKVLSLLSICTILVMTAGCGSSASDKGSQAQNAPPPVSHTVFAPYVRDINKAKNVQNTVNAQKQSLDKQIQAQSGSSNAPSATSQSPL